MDFTHKFASGPVPIDKLLSEYFNPGKVRRNGSQTAYSGKRYSNPPFSFREEDFLKKFKYIYPIGREYEIPREDRQKTIGASNVAAYKRQLEDKINLVCWNDLLSFEKDHPGSLALVPGPCQICERTHEGCARPKNEPCRHLGMMRFSMEGIGIDADTLAKFETGLLPKWPDDGKLPQKVTAVMGILSNDLIPVEDLKEAFKDAEKNFLNLSERESADPNILSPEIKRATSWLDEQTLQRKALEQKKMEEEQKAQERALPSEHLDNAPVPESELPGEHIKDALVKEPESLEKKEASAQAEEVSEEEEDKKYKWLGFKRSVDEANRNFYNRPIPKFNVSEEEETEEAVPSTNEEESGNEEVELNYSFKRTIEEEDESPEEAIPKWKTNPALIPDEEEETVENKNESDQGEDNSEESDTDMMDLLSQIDTELLAQVLMKKLEEDGKIDSLRELSRKNKEENTKPVEIKDEISPSETKHEEAKAQDNEPDEDEVSVEIASSDTEEHLPDASSLEDVLSAALSIAQSVSGEKPQQKEAEKEKTELVEEKKAPVRHSYKWLNYKSELKDEDDDGLRDWKDRK